MPMQGVIVDEDKFGRTRSGAVGSGIRPTGGLGLDLRHPEDRWSLIAPMTRQRSG